MTDEELFAKLKEMADKKIYLLDSHPDFPDCGSLYEHVETIFYDEDRYEYTVEEESIFKNIETGTLFSIYQESLWDNIYKVFKTELHLAKEIPTVKMYYENTEKIF